MYPRNSNTPKDSSKKLALSLENLLSRLNHTQKLKEIMEARRKLEEKKEEAEKMVSSPNVSQLRVDTSDGPAELSRQGIPRHKNDKANFR